MKQNQDQGRATSLLLDAVAWALGGIFLLTITTATISPLINQIIGWLFIAYSVLLIIASFRNNLIPWIEKAEVRVGLAYPLFVTTLGDLFIKAAESKQFILVIIVLIISFLLIAGFTVQIVKIFKKH
jgi:hypothetical protein